MRILAIETSCDETAISLVEAEGNEKEAHFQVCGNALFSQIEIHKPYGGVFPALAKREHAKNLVPLLEDALRQADLLGGVGVEPAPESVPEIETILEREAGLGEALIAFTKTHSLPDIDAIAVTAGPGLEPALWVGVNFAKALSLLFKKPIVAVNHMEGHILSALAHMKTDTEIVIKNVSLPVLALLISGGHTELVLMKEWLSYERIGATRDDAVGEAFDKVARMLDLPYPGGPEVSRLAEARRAKTSETADDFALVSLPRPMLDTPTCDFSFAGLKTAVLYLLKGRENVTDAEKEHIAEEFENAAADVLFAKTCRALSETDAATLVLGGGVSANTHIRRTFETKLARTNPGVVLRIPSAALATDNAIMIALAGFYRAMREDFVDPETLVADGNKALGV